LGVGFIKHYCGIVFVLEVPQASGLGAKFFKDPQKAADMESRQPGGIRRCSGCIIQGGKQA
jgi:hypothetical protein